jgi:MFS family permease
VNLRISLPSPNWTALFGFGFFVGMMSVGYYYNLTFVQLGLVDLGERVIGMDTPAVAGAMALLAVLTCLIALGAGYGMKARGVGERFILKLRIAFVVVLAQALLTPLAPAMRSPEAYLAWLVACSLALGVGVPVTFSMTVDLVPRARRGLAAALITALAYLAANLVPSGWQVEQFAAPLRWVLPAGVVGLGVLAFGRLPLVDRLAEQHRRPEFHDGRYVRGAGADRRIVGLVILMFGIFFVDSLGFLRLLDTPRFMTTAWQSPLLNIRLAIGITHVVGALIAGVLYDALDVRRLFAWIFGIFALVHLMYTFNVRVEANSAPLAMPALYALAVSLYTVVNFAIWADVSTPRTIPMNAAFGVALSGWTATFVSTGLALWWETSGMPLSRHLNIVNALALLFLLAMLVQAYLPRRGPAAESRAEALREQQP